MRIRCLPAVVTFLLSGMCVCAADESLPHSLELAIPLLANQPMTPRLTNRIAWRIE